MRNWLQKFTIIIFVMVAILLLWGVMLSLRKHPSPSQLRETMQSAVASTEGYVKRHVTGGVGVALKMNANGSPSVQMVLLGSPAEIAGLRAGDIITQVGDWPTAGQPLAQVVENMRGFAGGRVAVTIQRPGISSNLNFVIKRSSWNALGETNIFAPATGTNVIP